MSSFVGDRVSSEWVDGTVGLWVIESAANWLVGMLVYGQ